MPKFIIEYDPSRVNAMNEPLPLMQFVPGPISLKNTNKVYTLFIGELNKSPFFNTIDVFKSNIELYKKILDSLQTGNNDPTQNTIIPNDPSLANTVQVVLVQPQIQYNSNTGQANPYNFSNINPKFIPPTITGHYLNNVRNKAMEQLGINKKLKPVNTINPIIM